MDLTASQAVDKAAAILEGLDVNAKKASAKAAVACAWLDLARLLWEKEHSIPSVPQPTDPGKRIHPDAFTG
jgi:hypothetical protein